MKNYALYDYLTLDTTVSPHEFALPPLKINPKKELTIRPYEDIVLEPTGEVIKIIYWEGKDKKVRLYEEQMNYLRDRDGLRTKNLAITQIKTIHWYFQKDENGEQKLDKQHSKTLITDYDKNQVIDSKGVKLPTSLQLYEWERKCKNQIHYMLTNEVARTLIDQAVFVLFDNLIDVINKWEKNPVSTAFSDAIKNKTGGFDIDIPKIDKNGKVELDQDKNPLLLKMNIWDVVVNTEGHTLQAFLYHRITGEVLT